MKWSCAAHRDTAISAFSHIFNSSCSVNADETCQWSLPLQETAADRASGCFGEGGEALSRLLYISKHECEEEVNSGENRGGKRGEGLAAGVLAVYSGIYYLACLKINQRLPQFPAHGASKFYHILLLPLSRSISEGLLNLLHVKITQVHRQAMCKTCRRCTKKREWHPSKQGIIKFKHCGSPCKEQKNNCVTPPWTQKQTQTAIQNIVIEGFKMQKWEKNESSPWKSKL